MTENQNARTERRKFRHRVTLLTRETGRDVFGGATEIWTDGPVIYASVEPIRGNEFWQKGQLPHVEAQVDARIRIRRRNGLDSAGLRVRHGRTVYDVVAVIQDTRNIETQLMVQARKLDQGKGQEVNP